MPMFSADLPSIDIHKRDSTILKKFQGKFNEMDTDVHCTAFVGEWAKADINNKYRKISKGICTA